MFRVRQVDVARLIHDPPIDLLRHAKIEAPVARLHVENRDMAALGGNDREQLFVSPRRSSASGFSFAKTLSAALTTIPIVAQLGRLRRRRVRKWSVLREFPGRQKKSG